MDSQIWITRNPCTDNDTEFINNEITTSCHLYEIKHKPGTSRAPWTNELVEGVNRSLRIISYVSLTEMIVNILKDQLT